MMTSIHIKMIKNRSYFFLLAVLPFLSGGIAKGDIAETDVRVKPDDNVDSEKDLFCYVV